MIDLNETNKNKRTKQKTKTETENTTLVSGYYSADQICLETSIKVKLACKDCKVFYWDKLYKFNQCSRGYLTGCVLTTAN